jgi:hypothetical protein
MDHAKKRVPCGTGQQTTLGQFVGGRNMRAYQLPKGGAGIDALG